MRWLAFLRRAWAPWQAPGHRQPAFGMTWLAGLPVLFVFEGGCATDAVGTNAVHVRAGFEGV